MYDNDSTAATACSRGNRVGVDGRDNYFKVHTIHETHILGCIVSLWYSKKRET